MYIQHQLHISSVLMYINLASYQGLLTQAFVACSTNAGEGLVKLSHVQWRTWTCGGVAYSWESRK